MATHRSSLLLGGDTPVREDPTSVIVISEASKATDCAERGRAKRDLGCTDWPSACTLVTTYLSAFDGAATPSGITY